MRALLQRVSEARVTVGEEAVGAVGHGLLVLLCAVDGDTDDDARWLAQKVAKLRIFEDDEGRMNRAVTDVGGGVLVVSQFTLAADAAKGNRPSFVHAAAPERAVPLLDVFMATLRDLGLEVATGRFGAHMAVQLVNDGPVTIWLDTKELRR